MPEKKDTGKAAISGWTIVAGMSVLALFGIGYLIYRSVMAKSEEYQKLLKSWQEEVQELTTYQAGNPTNEGIQARVNLMRAKELRMKGLNTSWLVDAANAATQAAQGVGMNIILPIVGVAAGYLIYLIVKEIYRNRPRDGGTYRCEKDGYTFPTQAELQQHTQTQHQASTNSQDIASAQAMVTQEAIWVQDTIAATSGLYGTAKQPWSTLAPQQILSLAWAIEAMIGMGITGPAIAIAAALLII